jgi:hypothetical protein
VGERYFEEDLGFTETGVFWLGMFACLLFTCFYDIPFCCLHAESSLQRIGVRFYFGLKAQERVWEDRWHMVPQEVSQWIHEPR